MSIRVKAEIDEPEELDVTLTITMTLKEWTQLAEQLQDKYPSWQLTCAISDVVYKAKDVFIAEDQT